MNADRTAPDPDDGQDVGRSTLVMAAGTATSRVFGIIRISVLVTAIGANAGAANAFSVANWLPNMLYMLVAGGVLNAVLVPQVVRAYKTGSGQAYVDRLLTLAGTLLLALTVLLTLSAPLIVRLAVSDKDPEFVALATAFALWCIPQVFFYGTYTLLGQVLNARGSFGPYMWAPVVNNVVAIAGMVVFMAMFGRHVPGRPLDDFGAWDSTRIAVLAGTATLGVVAQAVVLLIPLYRSGFRYRPRGGWRGAGLGTAGRVAAWTFAALVIGQVATLVVTNISSRASQEYAADVAGNTVYTLAFTVFMLPHSLVTVSLLTALFTRLSAHAATSDHAAVRADFSYGLRLIGVFTVFATAVVSVLALPVVRVILPGTSPAEAGSLAPVIVAMMVGLSALGAWSLCQRVYYAYEDARGLFRIQVAMAVVVVLVTVLGYLLLPVGWWVAAAGAGISLSYVLGAVWGGLEVRTRLGGRGAAALQMHVKAVVAAVVSGAAGWGVSRVFGDLASAGFGKALVVCAVVGLVMLAVYAGLLRLMRVEELAMLVDPLLARLGRSMGGPGGSGAARSRGDQRPGAGKHGGDLLDVVIGQGTLLAGRYRLVHPVSTDLPGVESWTAQDQILDRPVRALVLRTGRVQQAQDAARRAALVTDPRLLRVLDVGQHEGVPYTVTEPVVGRDLAELTARGPLPADQARAIIGEAAVALEVARRRGVHHLALRPSAVHVTPDGGVVVSGLGMDGELTGHPADDARSTTRADTVGLVSLLYLTLTGRWPAAGGTDPGHTPVAPLVGGSPVPPAELSPAVPNDLDTLCAVTLGPHDDGPYSPAELVRELEPWGPVAAEEIFGALDAASAWSSGAAGSGAGPADTAAGARAGSVPVGAGGDALTGDEAATGALEGEPGARPTVQRQSVRSTFAETQPNAAARPGTPPPAIPPAYRPEDPRTVPPRTGAPVGAGHAFGASSGVSAAAAPTQTVAMNVVGSEAGPAAAGSGRQGPPVVPPRRPSAQLREGAVGAGSSHVASTHAGSAEGHPKPHRPAPRPAAAEVSHESFDVLIGRSTDVLVKKRFDPTPFVLALVALAVVVGLVLAWQALTAPAPPIGDGAVVGGQTEPTTPGEGEAPVDEGGEAPAEEPGAEPPAAAVPTIASAQMIDPPPGGDNNEHPEAVPAAIDGDPGTFWYTRTYKSPTYGMKPGIGYAVTLTEPALVTTVTLQVNGSGGMVEVRATDPTTPTAGDVLASGPLGPETVLTLSTPTEAQHIVLWFTALPQTADGSNRVELAEVRLS